MKRKVWGVFVAVLYAAAVPGGVVGQVQSSGEVKMEQVGRTFLFDYGDLVIRVRYLSDRRLEWEQVKGPQAGLKGQEEYGSSAIRPGVHFIWWQEKDTSIVTQVIDFEKKVVHTTWTSPEKKLAAFQGRIEPAP